jgi:hypothetical protein
VTAAELSAALASLERTFDAALLIALPNPVALIFTELPLAYQGKRDLVFALDLINEGENEAALIAGLAHARLKGDPSADVAHLEREALYYLRTSIDATWQFDDAPAVLSDALTYIETVLDERIVALRAAPLPRFADPATPENRRALLDRIRNSHHALPSRSAG